MKKRLLSLLLAMILCVPVLGNTDTAMAAEETDEENYEEYYYDELEDGTLEITGYYNTAETYALKIPSTIDGKKVTRIGDNAFSNDIFITSVTIPSTVKSIGERAFNGCEEIKSITIPSTVTEIEDFAFSNSGLVNVSIPKSIKAIGEGLFSDCEYLENVTIASGITEIGEFAFENCINLKGIVIPYTVKSIKESAFSNCELLTDIIIGSGVKSIEYCAFDECDLLTNVYYNGSSTNWKKIEIGDYNDIFETVKLSYQPSATWITSVKAGSKKFTVNWTSRTGVTGYQIQYSTNSSFSGAKTVTLWKSSYKSKQISSLAASKKYYVRVRTFKSVKVNGKSEKIYSAWSKAKTVTTSK